MEKSQSQNKQGWFLSAKDTSIQISWDKLQKRWVEVFQVYPNGNFKKRKMIFTWCRTWCHKADFIFSQKRITQKKRLRNVLEKWLRKWSYYGSYGNSSSCGVATLVKKGVDCTIHSKFLDRLGRCVILKVEIKDEMYVLINISAPNKNNCETEENITMGGDFKCLPNPFF